MKVLLFFRQNVRFSLTDTAEDVAESPKLEMDAFSKGC